MADKQHRLKWTDLLDRRRVRSLFGGPGSRVDPEDVRTEFERDYGRTVYSTPFRRLRDKTQVFPLERNDSVRTRLLHSLEVSSVAEDLATQSVRDVIAKDESASSDELQAVPLVAATCGLVHDIGNPPFGHAGELAIQTWFRHHFEEDEARVGRAKRDGQLLTPDVTPSGGNVAHCGDEGEGRSHVTSLGGKGSQMVQDFWEFEGNAQGIRTISNLFLLTDNFGLNLTAGTLAAALKYVAPSNGRNPKVHELKKPGFFTSENDRVAKVRDATGTLDCRHPIAYLVEAADDIVYCSVDLEDGIRRGGLAWGDVEERLLKGSGEANLVKKAIERAHEHAAPARLHGKEESDALAQTLRVNAISLMAIAARQTFRMRYDAIMNGEYHEELLMDPSCEARPFVEAAKEVLRSSLYTQSDVLRLEVRGREVIHKLLSFFWEAVSTYEGKAVGSKTYGGKLYLLLSPNYRRVFEERLERGELNELYCRLQLAADQVAGMTDTYACRLHNELTVG